MKRKAVLSLTIIVIVVSLFCLLNAEEKYTYTWKINANGHEGILQYNVNGIKVTGTVLGNKIEGYQVGRHIIFHRSSTENQLWSGWIWNGDGNKGPTIAGSFSHRGENSYPWHGITE